MKIWKRTITAGKSRSAGKPHTAGKVHTTEEASITAEALHAAGLRRQIPAGITVEAAFCLPLFLFTAVTLLAPIKLMDERRQLQNTMEAAAKDMAKAVYAERIAKELGSGILNRGGTPADETLSGLLDGVGTGLTVARILSSLDGEVFQNAVFSRCEVGRNDKIELELQYELRLPFQLFSLKSIPMSSVVSRRAWTGAEGGRGRSEYGPGGDGEEEDGYDRDDEGDEVVYQGKTSTVYHKKRNCHYLDNQLKKVDASRITEERNASGGKYHACASCRPEASGQVYIMESGTAYHKDAGCKAIGAYVREVKRRETEGMGACSYCSGGGHEQ